jgi:putative membrane protein
MSYGWRTAMMIVGAALALPALAQAQAQQGMPYYGYGPGMMWGGWFHMFFGFLMMIVFLAIIVGLVVLGIRWLGASGHSPFRQPPTAGQHTALDILKERLARGEIDVAEYEERRRALGE